MSHYHHARIQAFALRWAGPVTVIQVSDTSGFSAFKHHAAAARPAYRLVTLFCGEFYRTIPASRLRPALRQALGDASPSVVCVQGWSDRYSLEVLRWAVGQGVRAVVMTESQQADAPRKFAKEWVKGRLLTLFGAALAGGATHAEYLRELGVGAERVFLGYDAVDNDHFAAGADAAQADPAARAAHRLPATPFWLASARFIPKKNLAGLLDGYARYRSAVGPGAWDLVLLGDGNLRPDLERRRAEEGLGGCVHMPGFVGYADLPAYYGLASGFVHASTSEQWGLVVNEAAASGLPLVVSAACGSARELVRDGGNGHLFDPADPAALCNALARVHHSDRRREMGVMSRQLVADWGPDRFADGLAGAVLASLAAPERGRAIPRLLLGALAATSRGGEE